MHARWGGLTHVLILAASGSELACIAEEGRPIVEPSSTGQLPGAPPPGTSEVSSGSGTSTGSRSTGLNTPTTSSTTAFPTSGDDDDDSASGQNPLFDIPDVGTIDTQPNWLVNLTQIDGEIHLHRIDIDTAVATDVCTLIDPDTSLPLPGWSTTVTFTRDDRLVFTLLTTHLYEVELPSCNAVEIGPIGYSQVNGITPDEGDNLFGITANANVLLRIDAQTGVGTEVGPLVANWTQVGGTWSEIEQQLYGINSADDALYDIDRLTGASMVNTVLPLELGSIGMEYHPLTEQIYVCSDDAHLYRLEDDGSMTDLGHTGLNGCNNLGAPWLPDVPLPAI